MKKTRELLSAVLMKMYVLYGVCMYQYVVYIVHFSLYRVNLFVMTEKLFCQIFIVIFSQILNL